MPPHPIPSSSSSQGIDLIPPTPPVASHEPTPPKDLGPPKPPVPTTDMSVLQKKRLLHLFVDTLTEGVCPELVMVSSTLKVEPTLVAVDPGTAMSYLKSRVTTTITSKSVVQEHQAWLASRRPLPPGPSQGRLRTFSDSQTAALNAATSHLSSSAVIADVTNALSCCDTCRSLGMVSQDEGGHYTRQQLRDKLKSLRKSLDKHRK